MFNSKYSLGDKFFSVDKDARGIDLLEQTIKNEPMFFNSNLEFAMERGGAITKSFLSALPEGWKKSELVFDSRVHMLMHGWYPAIPGWHHDDVPRNTESGQPNYDSTEYTKVEHCMGLVNAEVCPTQFAVGKCGVFGVESGEIVYKHWHEEVEKLIKQGTLKREEAPDRRLIFFNAETFHTGVGAKKAGWRWFGRVSRGSSRVKNITNEIRQQVQVYLEFPMEGW